MSGGGVGGREENETRMQKAEDDVRWRKTYSKHGVHVRHRAHVPITDGLIEGFGILQHGEGRAAMWREQ